MMINFECLPGPPALMAAARSTGAAGAATVETGADLGEGGFMGEDVSDGFTKVPNLHRGLCRAGYRRSFGRWR